MGQHLVRGRVDDYRQLGKRETLGIIVCGAMIYGLGWTNWMRLIVWLAIGLVFYFFYGRSHSRIDAPPPEMPEGIRMTR